MFRPILVALALLVALPLSAKAEEVQVEVNQIFRVRAYCADQKHARALSAIVAERGNAGYLEVMANLDIKCVDARFHPVPPALALVVELLWTVQLPTGEKFQFVLAKDRAGRDFVSWVWVNPEAKGEPV